MITVHIEQGSEAWFQERCGRFTASKFATLMSGESTKGYKDLILETAGEAITGTTEESYTNAAMERGTELEPDARREFEDIQGVEVDQVGFCLPDDISLTDWVGVSPDGVFLDHILEIKCPMLKTHMGYINANRLPSTYKWQVQGQLWITGARTCFFMSYYPGLKPFIIEVFPDLEMHNQLRERALKAIVEVKQTIKNYDLL